MEDFLKATIFVISFIIFSFLAAKLLKLKKENPFFTSVNVLGIPFIFSGLVLSFFINDIFPRGKALFIFAPFLIVIISFIGFLYASNIVIRYLKDYGLSLFFISILYFVALYYGTFYVLKILSHLNPVFFLKKEEISILSLSSVIFSPYFLYLFKKEYLDKDKKMFILFLSYMTGFLSIIFFGLYFYKEKTINFDTFRVNFSFILILVFIILAASLFSLLTSKLKREEVLTLSIGIFAVGGGIATLSDISIITVAAILSFLYVNMPYRIKEYKLIPHLILLEKPVYIMLLFLIPLFFFDMSDRRIFYITLIFIFIRFIFKIIGWKFLKLIRKEIPLNLYLPFGPLPFAIGVSYFFIVGQRALLILNVLILSQIISDLVSATVFSLKIRGEKNE